MLQNRVLRGMFRPKGQEINQEDGEKETAFK
jgi:hypothetical protein